MLAGDVTVRVTGMLTARPPLGVITMVPEYVLAASALELTLIVKAAGVVLVALALVDSQAPPAVPCVVKVTPAAPAALLTLTVLAAGLDPCVAAKVSRVGDTVTFPAVPPPELFTVSVTSRVCTTLLAEKEMVAV